MISRGSCSESEPSRGANQEAGPNPGPSRHRGVSQSGASSSCRVCRPLKVCVQLIESRDMITFIISQLLQLGTQSGFKVDLDP